MVISRKPKATRGTGSLGEKQAVEEGRNERGRKRWQPGRETRVRERVGRKRERERSGSVKGHGKRRRREREANREKDKSLMSSGDMMIITMQASACMVQRNPRLLLYLFPPSLPPPPPSRAPARARAFMPGISSVFSRNQYSGCTETLMYSRLTSCPNRAASWRTDESIPRNWELVFRRLVCIYIYTYMYNVLVDWRMRY